MPEDIIQRFLRAIGKLSASELYQLAALLRSETERAEAISVITNLANLKAESQKATAAVPKGVSPVPLVASIRAGSGISQNVARRSDVRSSFFALLRDNSCFADNEAIATAIKDAFQIDVVVSHTRKESRERLIARAWKEIRQLPPNELDRNLRILCSRNNHLEGRDAYKELFRILSKGE